MEPKQKIKKRGGALRSGSCRRLIYPPHLMPNHTFKRVKIKVLHTWSWITASAVRRSYFKGLDYGLFQLCSLALMKSLHCIQMNDPWSPLWFFRHHLALCRPWASALSSNYQSLVLHNLADQYPGRHVPEWILEHLLLIFTSTVNSSDSLLSDVLFCLLFTILIHSRVSQKVCLFHPAGRTELGGLRQGGVGRH